MLHQFQNRNFILSRSVPACTALSTAHSWNTSPPTESPSASPNHRQDPKMIKAVVAP
jgi:hypothetical protein